MTPAGPDPEPSPDEQASRRSRLEARRRRNVRIGSALIIIVLIAAGVGAAVYATDDARDPAKAAGAAVSPAASFGQLTLPQVAPSKAVALRTLDHQHPLRLWVGGDSLAGSFGPALGDQVGATGVVQTRIDYKVSSGLWSNDIRNWPDEAKVEMAADDPEAVVYIIGANDTSAVNKVDANGDGTADWEPTYRAKVDLMMNEFVGTTHRTVFWLGAPTLGTESMNAAAIEIDRVVKEEAAKHAPDVIFVDTYHLFAGPDGTYSRQIVDEKGDTITARIADGVHFSQDGAAYLSRAVFSLIESRFHITEHADLMHPIAWAFANGNGELVPGYQYRPQSRYHSSNNNGGGYTPTPNTYGGGTTQTTVGYSPPTTESPPPPPTTSPPPPPPPTTVASPPTSG